MSSNEEVWSMDACRKTVSRSNGAVSDLAVHRNECSSEVAVDLYQR